MRTDNDYTPESVRRALAGSAEEMTRASRADVRHRVMRVVRADARGGFFASMSRRVAVAMTALSVLTGGVAYAANSSLPGEPLYGIKRAAEDVLVALLPAGGLERRLLVGLAARRAAEAGVLSRSGAAQGLVDDAIAGIREAVQQATSDEGMLADHEADRIQNQAGTTSEPTRSAIEAAVSAPDSQPGSGAPASGPNEPSGGDAAPGPGPGSDGDAPGPSDGSGEGSQAPDGSGSGSGEQQGPSAPGY